MEPFRSNFKETSTARHKQQPRCSQTADCWCTRYAVGGTHRKSINECLGLGRGRQHHSNSTNKKQKRPLSYRNKPYNIPDKNIREEHMPPKNQTHRGLLLTPPKPPQTSLTCLLTATSMFAAMKEACFATSTGFFILTVPSSCTFMRFTLARVSDSSPSLHAWHQ